MRLKVRFGSSLMMRAAAVPRAHAIDKRVCYNCNELGHLYVKRPHSVIVAVGDENDDELALYGAAMRCDDASCRMTRSMCVQVDDHDHIFFSPAEVILDDTASRSLFENRGPPREIVQGDAPTVIRCAQRGATGIRVDEEGLFRDIGIAGVCLGATGNILSAGQMVDTGRQVQYDTTKDEYVASGFETDYVFGRRMKYDGSNSRFYTHGVALVVTFKENLRRNTSVR
jgi:hypothetical protein